ncbi:4-deoxy-L-threo-5-hexosulose-uronateketol-isomer ase [Beutenbergia cavernae DSM 12333]|uniref:4-deoxy-L-threo-5-hexosulose-uronate ketol-isomerase n=1 Tax=Beutenbergia cavernae (strain ATCC BAA-8 / DSM 12333 / CCUG 43141 / JCM 11478 / NBRC 16432 / NCIMB 13614 / HKI 0122) TaxID=471853 RepID=C5BY11_BEUC1|nr:5-dehydro-4-deoxy-D-glucuronate isomerase [Beutenbergia cavernae]ACQ78905.1 4-deoxy-L-threo-5-hexosulose-uronateketol-isomer ase [Beutenbergia cavernae DSM 12333]
MDIRHSTHPDDAARLDPEELRARFLVEDLFAPGEVRLTLTHDDRIVIGGAVPDGAPLTLEPPAELRTATFCARRELAVVNVGDGAGTVTVDGSAFDLGHHDVLYVGVGASSVAFAGDTRFYLVSAPAGARHPTTLARAADAETLHLGEPAASNVRSLRRYVHAGGVASERLVLGITTLEPGSVWNTMPPHTHDRRTEVYLYTGLGAEGRVIHLCGRPDELRTLVVGDGQAVVSPPWSVHTGAGTAAYSFVWAMAGENQAFDDMDAVAVADLR